MCSCASSYLFFPVCRAIRYRCRNIWTLMPTNTLRNSPTFVNCSSVNLLSALRRCHTSESNSVTLSATCKWTSPQQEYHKLQALLWVILICVANIEFTCVFLFLPDCKYRGTSLCVYLCKAKTSSLQTVFLSPEHRPGLGHYLCNQDTSLNRTAWPSPPSVRNKEVPL